MYCIYLMSFINVIHLMCWNYLIDLIHLMDRGPVLDHDLGLVLT